MVSETLVILLTQQGVRRGSCRAAAAHFRVTLESTPMTPLDVFGGVMYLLFFAPFLFPLAPWFAKRPRGAWLVCCAAVSVLVLLFPAMFWWGCDWSNCGQGAVAIFTFAPVWLLFAVITPLSAWAAVANLHARRHPTRPGPLPDRPPVRGVGDD